MGRCRYPNGPVVQVLGELVAAGAEMFVYQLSLQLKADGRDVEVWYFYNAADIRPDDEKAAAVEKDMLEGLAKAGIRVRALRKTPNSNYISTWRKLRSWAREVRPSVVHCHLEEISFHVCMAMTATGIPVVQTMHSSFIRRQSLLKHYFKHSCDVFVCISEEVERSTWRFVPPALTVRIPNGVPIRRFLFPERDCTRPVRQMIAVGRLHPIKDHRMMIEALSLVKQGCEEKGLVCPTLDIFGEGELRAELEGAVDRLGLKANCRLPGITSDIPEKLKRADLYLMSSLHEGMSISLLESMASGVPIVITAVSGTEGLLEDGRSALIVPIGDKEAFAAAVLRLLQDAPLRKTLSENAVKTAMGYDMTFCAARYEALYDHLIRGGPPTTFGSGPSSR